MKRDLHHILQDDSGGTSTGIVQHIVPAVQETSLEGGSGSGVDLKQYRSCEILIDVGAYVDGSQVITIKESDSADRIA